MRIAPGTPSWSKKCGDGKLGDVTIAQAIGGARGIKCLVTDISYLDPFEGIRFRGMTIPETFDALPKVPGSEYPYVEGFWYLLLTGDVPTLEQAQEVVADWKTRATVPQYVYDVLDALPDDAHPMAMFSTAVLAMKRDSVFANNYPDGKFNKMTCWEDMYEDSNNMMAKLGPIGAYIYNKKYRDKDKIAADPNVDMGANYAYMIGLSNRYNKASPM